MAKAILTKPEVKKKYLEFFKKEDQAYNDLHMEKIRQNFQSKLGKKIRLFGKKYRVDNVDQAVDYYIKECGGISHTEESVYGLFNHYKIKKIIGLLDYWKDL